MTKYTDLPANSWNRPAEVRNLTGEFAGDELNAAARPGESTDIPKGVLNTLLEELNHSQALTRKLLKQLASQ